MKKKNMYLTMAANSLRFVGVLLMLVALLFAVHASAATEKNTDLFQSCGHC